MEYVFWSLIIVILALDFYNLYKHYNDEKMYAKFDINDWRARHGLPYKKKNAKILPFKKDKK